MCKHKTQKKKKLVELYTNYYHLTILGFEKGHLECRNGNFLPNVGSDLVSSRITSNSWHPLREYDIYYNVRLLESSEGNTRRTEFTVHRCTEPRGHVVVEYDGVQSNVGSTGPRS